MSDHTEIVPTAENGLGRPATPNPLAMLQTAIDKGMDIDKLGRLFDLAERYDKAQAAIRFADALTRFQARCPRVVKDRTATIHGREGKQGYSYKFASFEDVDRVAAPLLAEFGIVVTFSTEHVANGAKPAIKTTCRVRVGTHTEDTTMTIPIPALLANDTQQYGAALTYAQRYTMCGALKIVVVGEDDDGSNLVERLDAGQITELRKELDRTGTKEAAFLHWMAAERIEDVLARDFAKALDFLRRKPAVKTKPQKEGAK